MPGVGTNRYSYSFNDPANLRDPGGNAPDYGYGVPDSYEEGNRGYYTSQAESRSDYAESIQEFADLTYDDPTYDGLTYTDRLALGADLDYHTRTMSTIYQNAIPAGPNAQRSPFMQGFRSYNTGLARCVDYCDDGYQAIAEISQILATNAQARNYAVEALSRNKARVAGRLLNGMGQGAAASVITSPVVGTAIGIGASLNATAGDLGYYVDLARSAGVSLSTQQVLDILANGNIEFLP